MGFGILLESKGYAWWWAALMSVTIYAGSMQYVAIDLLAGGARKPYLIFALTDETFSLVCAPNLPEGVRRKNYYFLVPLIF